MTESNFPKVLIACPTSDHKEYCQDEWCQWVLGFDYPNKHILIVDNSESPKNANYLKKTYPEIETIYIGNKVKGKTIREKIFESTVLIRDYFLNPKHGFAKWLSIESDIFIPQNSIQYLLAYDFPVIGFPYFHFSGEKTILLQMHLHDVHGTKFTDYTSIEQSFVNFGSDVMSAYQCGIGCLMFDKKVIQQIEIRCPDTEFLGFPDYFLHIDMMKRGIKVAVDPSVICIHKNSDIKWNKISLEDKI